ncbi:MAG: alpha/beta hydrolase [Micrococcales bacterium]|nr:alpha/beta hydrolase [Micrococcales bacterium]OJX66766.1 MAG: alpha/beta hydrolase [Micrococcales bacterium 72-143]
MDVILVPGFWLRGESWDEVVPVVEAAGHRAHPLTRPGLAEGDDAASVTLAEQVEAIVAAIDATEGPVVLVGHSGGGPLVYAAAEQRLDRVARIVYVDTWPLPDGTANNAELPVVDGAVPLPEWSTFDEAELRDLDEAARERFRERAVPEPAVTARDPQVLHDDRRRGIPTTLIASSHSEAEYREWFESPFFAELVALEDVTWVELPTGHWPQFTRPRELGEAIVAAIS